MIASSLIGLCESSIFHQPYFRISITISITTNIVVLISMLIIVNKKTQRSFSHIYAFVGRLFSAESEEASYLQ